MIRIKSAGGEPLNILKITEYKANGEVRGQWLTQDEQELIDLLRPFHYDRIFVDAHISIQFKANVGEAILLVEEISWPNFLKGHVQ